MAENAFEETSQKRSDNVRQFPRRSSGFSKLGTTTRKMVRTPANFTDVPVRVVDDPEKVTCVLPDVPSLRRDDVYVCEHCHMPVSVEQNYHGWFRTPDGQIEPCAVCSKPVIRARNRRRATSLIKDLVCSGVFLDTLNLPVSADKCSLALYPGNADYKRLVQDFVDGTSKELLLFGKTGRGKTGLAFAAVHELYKRREQVLFLTMERYLDLLKDNFAPGAQPNHIKQIVTSVGALVLDDIAAGVLSEKSTGFSIKETLDVLEARHAAGLQTLLTTNFSLKGLGEYWYMEKYVRAEFQPAERVLSRLKGWYKVVEIEGRDLRESSEEE